MAKIPTWIVIVCVLATPVSAQNSADEKAIRQVIETMNAGGTPPYADDRVFWSGAFVRPNGPGEPVVARPNSEVGNRTNQKSAVVVKRIEVAKSGDLAYEYSHFKASWDMPDKRHVEREGAIVRVWKKVNGAWRIALSFQHPFDETPTK